MLLTSLSLSPFSVPSRSSSSSLANMAVLALAVLLLAFTGSTSANWCVCKDGSDAILQKTLDYACGAGADCNPIHQNGPCFQPNTVRAHCSYAVNSFFQKKGQGQGTCDFAGTATVTASDPSSAGCIYPSSASTAGTSTTPTTGTTTPTSASPYTGIGTPSTTTGSGSTTTATPYGATPGVLGGIGNGMGPTGSGMTTDDTSHGGLRLVDHILVSTLSILLFSSLMMTTLRL
ncbi:PLASMODESMATA CALLOSE-BINDING PROTEIN 3-like [Prosopis cineraria]|uniref:PLASMODESMATA CALLOSE-BINDING PROTEIN 3-like n=1 Tax=Prosopis cineraria TaxID=364024 RepID=UPI00240EC320|nr:PLASMODESMATA CALLOSE-BINDING PROTEIN 3-like [Prosopis cineraria]